MQLTCTTTKLHSWFDGLLNCSVAWSNQNPWHVMILTPVVPATVPQASFWPSTKRHQHELQICLELLLHVGNLFLAAIWQKVETCSSKKPPKQHGRPAWQWGPRRYCRLSPGLWAKGKRKAQIGSPKRSWDRNIQLNCLNNRWNKIWSVVKTFFINLQVMACFLPLFSILSFLKSAASSRDLALSRPGRFFFDRNWKVSTHLFFGGDCVE